MSNTTAKRETLDNIPAETPAKDSQAPAQPEVKEIAVLGRPTDYTEEIAEKICKQVADGMSLRAICEDPELPSRESVRRWLRDNETFRGQYVRAREEQADFYADSISEIAVGTLTGSYDPHAAKVAIDAYKWTASKLKPKVYGDRIDHTNNGKDLPRPILLHLSQNITTDDKKTEVIDMEVSQNAGNIQTGNIMDEISDGN